MTHALKFAFVIFLASVIDARSYGQSDGRIIGGETVNIKNYPYTVSIENRGSHICGGTIIASNIIITAAHCMMEVSNPEALTVRAGSSKRGAGGVVAKVETIVEHHLFPAPEGNEYDIALLLLVDMLKYSKKIKKIQLADDEDILKVNETATVTGWGRLSNGSIAKELQKVDLPIVDQKMCADLLSSFEKVTSTMVCAGYVGIGGKDACDGDSGGPMVVNDRLHGIVSWGRGCAQPDSPGVFTRITSYRKWIRSRVGL